MKIDPFERWTTLEYTEDARPHDSQNCHTVDSSSLKVKFKVPYYKPDTELVQPELFFL
mgnify:CR=1 FL=1